MKKKAAEHENNQLRLYSSDNKTIKKQPVSLTFSIFLNSKQITKLTIPAQYNNQQLMETLIYQLKEEPNPIHNVLSLQSQDGNEVLDYVLQIDDYPVRNYRNGQKFKVVLKEDVKSRDYISLGDFTFLKCLGSGASANVFLVRHRGNGRLYALKQVDKGYFVEFKRMEQILREKKIMTEVVNNFPFMAQLYASFESEHHLNFVLEFYPGGQMFYHLQNHRLSEEQAKLYFCQILLAFEYLHDKKIIYRDLKPENIMIDIHGHARLSDFGLCKINLDRYELTASWVGSLEYMAPQVKNNQEYNYSVDFYTLGAFLFQMVMGVPPYYNTHDLNFTENVSENYRSLVGNLIAHDVGDRLMNFKAIKTHPWLRNIKWDDILKMKYKMPYKVLPYQCYIHEEFRNVVVKDALRVQGKFDRLFDFFSFVKIDKKNLDFVQCYHGILEKQRAYPNKKSFEINMKKKPFQQEIKQKNPNRSSNSNSRTKKSASKPKLKKNSPYNNIYLKKQAPKADLMHRSTSPKNPAAKKYSIHMKHVKSGGELLKGMINVKY